MKLLFSSSDPREIERHVKRLVWARIPCSVCKDPADSSLGVWINEDVDFPRALSIFMNRATPRSLPHWVRAFDFTPTWDQRTGKPIPQPHQIRACCSLPTPSRASEGHDRNISLAPSVFQEFDSLAG